MPKTYSSYHSGSATTKKSNTVKSESGKSIALSLILHLAGIILAIIMICYSISYAVPEKRLYTSSYSWNDYSWSGDTGREYVGGDAYNYQMEASLKAGYMSGVMAKKSVLLVGGVLLLFLTLFSFVKWLTIREQTRLLSEHSNEQTEILKAISATSGKAILLYEEKNTAEKAPVANEKSDKPVEQHEDTEGNSSSEEKSATEN